MKDIPPKTIACIVALLVCLCGTLAHAADRPNIVFIMADDMGYECLSVNGGETYKTPNLDQLAKQSVRFTHAHATPICTPTRVQVMSGLYNSRNYTRFGHMAKDIKTFGNFFKDAGYATCIVGKWQLDGGYDAKPSNFGFDGPGHYGFDEYCLWQLTRTKSNKPNRFPNPGLEINGKEVDFKNGEYGPDILNAYARDFIERQAKADKPFLLYYPMLLPHWPFEPTPDSDDWDPTFRQNDKAEKGARKVDERYQDHFIDMVAYTDKMVGKILDQLEAAGVRENTLVIFTGDNGSDKIINSTLDGKPYPGGKGKTIMNGTHVPLIVDWPGKAKAGAVCDDLIDFTDMLPTMLGAAGVPMPEGFKPDGRSFLPQVKGQAGQPRDWVYCYFDPGKSEFAMTKRYKLYRSGKLFDLNKDFYEKSPIKPADRSDEQQAVVDKLQAVISEHTR